MLNKMFSTAAVASLLLFAAGQAHAAATIVNLNANPASGPVNAGPQSSAASGGAYVYTPVNVSLGAGTYQISLAGIAGGGAYNAYSYSAGNFTDAYWSVSANNGASALYQQQQVPAGSGTYTTAAAAFAAYAPSSYTVTLAAPTTLSFYIDDVSYPYFADDAGGVSLAINAVPEPATMAVVLIGLGGAMLVRRRSGQKGFTATAA